MDGPTTKAVLELGRQLAAVLEPTDTLGRWMAHYLAERLTSLDRKTGPERGIAEAEVADLILRLWSLRRHLPGARLPLADVDDVEAAIGRLAPGRGPWAYFGVFDTETEPSLEETETSTTLTAALLVDRLAGDLVRALVARAGELAEASDAAWVGRAAVVGDPTLRTIRRIRIADDGDEARIEEVGWDSEVLAGATALLAVVSAITAEYGTGSVDSATESRG